MDPILRRALNDLKQIHGCHTVILYGSRARGDFTEESDYDVMGIRAQGPKARDARVIEGKFLDAFVYSESDFAAELEPGFLRLRGGKVLLEEDGFATELLARVDKLFAQGPDPLSADEVQTRKTWVEKMLARIAKGDLEGNYRRVWLQFDLLETYFALRRQWYLGPKESFRWLSVNDPESLERFEAALKPGAADAELARLAERVMSVDAG